MIIIPGSFSKMVESQFQRVFLRVDTRQSPQSIRRIRIKVTVSLKKKNNYHFINVDNCRYGLPVNFQAILIHPHKKTMKRLRDVLNQLYGHLDGSVGHQSANVDVSVIVLVLFVCGRITFCF